jgi:phospholipid/cholesterol/gamma-HCH transport system permease protein
MDDEGKHVDAAHETTRVHPTLRFSRLTDDTLLAHIAGSWRMQEELPAATEVQQQLESDPSAQRLAFDTQDMTAWDSGFLTFLTKVADQCAQRQIEVDRGGLPEGVQRLLALAEAVPERVGARRTAQRTPWLARIGTRTIAAHQATMEMLTFLGEASLTFLKFFLGKARFRRSDLALILQETGSRALGIVSLISFLIGLILAFMGAVQLRQFGAQIYVADLVGLGMAREMAAIMTGIIMSGRTGAAFAAQLGTMQVNEEIDALTTMGISPMEFLVLPRILALVVMMPLLCVYANLLGILGGIVVATGLLDLSLTQYINETLIAVSLTDFGVGLFKSAVFGALVAIAGCMRGMQCGRSAQAVGGAATSAVVMGIVLIIVLDGIFAVITEAIGV